MYMDIQMLWLLRPTWMWEGRAMQEQLPRCKGTAHSPKNLSMALSAEVAEIIEHFQWLTEEQSKNLPQNKLDKVEIELADTLICLIRLADKLDVDLLAAAISKIKLNEKKYPVEKAKGNAKKYTEYV